MSLKKIFEQYGAYLALILAVGAAYANTLGNAFLFDDEFLIQKNRFLTSFSFLPQIFSTSTTAGFGGTDSFFRPLQIFLYLLLNQAFGQSPFAFHALNILLHGVNACLVLCLGMHLGLARGAAFCAALLWALHPLHTEAVTYMSATADPLYALLLLLGLVVMGRGRAALWPGLGCFLLALLAKESAIVFPALLCVMLFFKAERRWDIKTYLPSWPFWCVALAYLAARATVLDFDDSYSFYKEPNVYTENSFVRIYTFLATLADYARLILWPHDLHMDRIVPVQGSFINVKVLAGAALLVIWLFGAFALARVRYRRMFSFWSFVGLWYLAAYFPHSGVFVPMNALLLEHWMYVPSMGLALGGAGLLSTMPLLEKKQGNEFLLSAVLLLAGTLAVLTIGQNRVWQSPLTFYPHILTYEKGSARVYNNYAMALADAGRLYEAEENYRKAIDVWDVYPQTHFNLAHLLMQRGAENEAIMHYERALALDPHFIRAATALYAIYMAKGDKEKTDFYGKMLR